MRTAIFLTAILGYSIALPSLDWNKIQPKHAYVEPVNNASLPILPRVVGGTEVEPNSIPHQAAIIIDGARFCGATLITRSYVLTAAHCVEGSAYIQIILGAHNIREAEQTQIVVTSTNIIVHPNYNPVNLNNDVGLVRFPNPIVLNTHIRLVTLAPITAGSFVDVEATLTGWGRTTDASTSIASTLHEANVPIMANFWCSRTYGTEVVRDFTLCTSGVGGLGGCDGDSGGPLMVQGLQVGIASFVASTGCQAGLPTGFARITSFRTWIAQNSDLDSQ